MAQRLRPISSMIDLFCEWPCSAAKMRRLEDASTSRPWDATRESPQSLVHHIIDMGEHLVAPGVSPRKVIAINAVDSGIAMRATTLTPGVKGSSRLEDMPEPTLADGPILVRTLALGVCGTDREILAGNYGEAPPGHDRLILGHESLGAVNANRSHYEMAAQALSQADKAWLGALITRRVPLARWSEALEDRPDDIKVVIDFTR